MHGKLPPAVVSQAAAAETPEEIRVLPVVFDSADERFCSYDSAVNSHTEEDFTDWPIDWPRSVYAVLKQLRRDGRHFLQQHDDWVLRSHCRFVQSSSA